MTYPLLQSALARLNLNLDAELKRYRHHEEVLPIDSEINQDSDPFFSSNFNELDTLEVNSELEDRDSDIPMFGYLDDLSNVPSGKNSAMDLSGDSSEDLAGDSSEDLEHNLEEEFRDRLMPRISDNFTADFGENLSEESTEDLPETSNQNSQENPNFLSPLGAIAMILLLVSSAAVGYLLVDPSGLNRFFKQEDNNKPTSSLSDLIPFSSVERLEFVTGTSSTEPVPFVDFSVNKPSPRDSSKLPINLPTLTSPIGVGRSFEPPTPLIPITVQPEIKSVRDRPIDPSINSSLNFQNSQNLSKSQSEIKKELEKELKVDKNLILPEQVRIPIETIPQSNLGRSPTKEETAPKLLSPPSVSENKLLGDTANFTLNSEPAVKIDKPEVQEFD